MLDIKIRDKNQIITLAVPGKTPLQGRRGSSLYYHNPLDFLLAALGTCLGGEISDYCRFNELNPQVFEKVNLALDGSSFIITIRRPTDFEQNHMDRLSRRLTSCTVSKYLSQGILVRWDLNEKPTQELIKEPKGCCGQ